MIRKIIKIDEERCNGCGTCATACHEGAIEMIDGKAKLTREDYCDGLGDCLPACPTGAITFEEREAPAYDEEAVLIAKQQKKSGILPCGCPGTQAKEIKRENSACSVVRRHIVGGANRTLISVETPLRSCRIGTCRRLSAG